MPQRRSASDGFLPVKLSMRSWNVRAPAQSLSLIWICRVDEGQVQEIRVYIDDSALRAAITASS